MTFDAARLETFEQGEDDTNEPVGEGQLAALVTNRT